jgi:hypothetical protein
MSTRGGVVDGSAQQAGVRPCSELVSFRDLPPGTYTFRVRPVGESSWLEWSWEVVSP